MKILITGAHFTPAVAVAEELKKIDKVGITYVGRKATLEGDKTGSVESKILPSLGVKFMPITAGRLQRAFTFYTIPSLLKIPVGFIQAFFIVLSEKPDVILSFGGYVAVPIVLAGWLLSVPIIIHEQTLVGGLANKISSYFADKIAVSFEKNLSPKENFLLTGNPIRNNIINLPKLQRVSDEYRQFFTRANKEGSPIILFTGGNQGSHIINLAVEECIDKLVKKAFVIHITGDNRFEDFQRLRKRQGDRYLVRKWIDNEWGVILSKADLVISRAGINTLMELAYLGKPTLVIPLPYLYKDEQNKNAKFFEDLGLAKILFQSKLSGETLFENIKSMLANLKVLKVKAVDARSVVIADAAKRLALETILLGKKINI